MTGTLLIFNIDWALSLVSLECLNILSLSSFKINQITFLARSTFTKNLNRIRNTFVLNGIVHQR